MSRLTIITINYNNASGLKKTMDSIFSQTSIDFEYIVVDGNSTDGSVEVIKQFDNSSIENFLWISESDFGIYNAMNKGIRMAKGEYVQFLNSGDMLASNDVTEKMLACLFPPPQGEGRGVRASILYGNMLKPLPKRIHRDKGFAGRVPTMLDFYTGTLNHSSAYIKRSLFDTYGLYDESLRIVSDWKWYLQVIALHGVIPEYKDIDVTVFDMNGISSVNVCLDKEERFKVLTEILPMSVLKDYERWSFPIEQMKRINRHWITSKIFWLIERVLFKWDKCFRR
ncbi:MAG: glycosyltransferase [Paludibacter sp.]|nr:glycosyltransferase [Paludibacter sp.]